MISFRDEASPRRPTFKKILYHPLTWVAVGFHLLLLTVPFSTEPDAVTEVVAEEAEAMPIDLLNLSEIATSAPLPPQVETAPPLPAAPQASPAAARTPVAAPVPTAAPVTPQPVVNMPVPVMAQPQAQPAQALAYDSTADRKTFIQGFDAIAAAGLVEYDELPLASAFPQGNAQYFLGQTALATDFKNPVMVGDSGSLPTGAATAKYTDKQPKDVLRTIQESFAPTGVSFTPMGEYGGEPLYELKKQTGETFAFVSLVGFQGSTLTVTWTQNPNGG